MLKLQFLKRRRNLIFHRKGETSAPHLLPSLRFAVVTTAASWLENIYGTDDSCKTQDASYCPAGFQPNPCGRSSFNSHWLPRAHIVISHLFFQCYELNWIFRIFWLSLEKGMNHINKSNITLLIRAVLSLWRLFLVSTFVLPANRFPKFLGGLYSINIWRFHPINCETDFFDF